MPTESAARPGSIIPCGVAADNAGNLYVADTDNDTIRKIVASTGAVTTFAGLAGSSGSADGTGSAARFNNPSGVAVDGAGNVYVADTLNNTLRKVSASGVVSTLAGSTGTSGSTDGTGTAALFYGPQGLAIDAGGNLYVADTNNHTIRKVVPSTGVVTTVAGLAGNSGSTDGLAAWPSSTIPRESPSTGRAISMWRIPTTTRSGLSRLRAWSARSPVSPAIPAAPTASVVPPASIHRQTWRWIHPGTSMWPTPTTSRSGKLFRRLVL